MDDISYTKEQKEPLCKKDVELLYRALNNCNEEIAYAIEKRTKIKNEIITCFYEAGWLDCLELNTKAVDNRWEEEGF